MKNIEEIGDEISQCEAGHIIELAKCMVCEGSTLRKLNVHYGFEPDSGFINAEVLYPSEPNIPSFLPRDIEVAYRSALKVRHVDNNAFGVLLGRVLEMVCMDKAANGDSLSQRLKDLAIRRAIPDRLAEVAHKLRQLRNIGAHPGLGELTPEEMPVLEQLCRALLEYVYSMPALLDQAQLCLDQLGKKNGMT